MKNKNLFILLLSCLLITTSCNGGKNETITGVEIAGPTSVLFGETIRLTADVLGTDDDEVTWKSTDESVAIVSLDGLVTGVSEGSVDIIATSIKDITKSATYTINVTLPKATQSHLFIEENENITYDEETKTYMVPLGHSFYIDTAFLTENVRIPDVSYSLLFDDGSNYNAAVSLEIINESTRAKVTSLIALTNLTIISTSKYTDLSTENLISSIKVNIIDFNIDKFSNVQQTIKSFQDIEKTSLVSSKLSRSKTTTLKENDTSTKQEQVLTHYSYLNSSYVRNEIINYENNSLIDNKTLNYYQGIENDNYYCFEYGNDNKIIQFFNSKKEDVDMMFDIHSGIVTNSYSSILTNIVSSTTTLYDGDIESFGNVCLYANTNISLEENKIIMTSIYFDTLTNTNYDLSLTINYNQTKIVDYTFIEEIDNGVNVILYEEKGSDFEYGSKVLDSASSNNNYLNLNQYYMSDFTINQHLIVDPNGRYDYSDTTKYGAVEGVENNLVKYTTSYDKTIILKVDALTPSTADVNFDRVKLESSDSNQIPSVEMINDGIFVINAKKDEITAESFVGKATFTFTSLKGVSKQVIIEFTETILTGVNVTFSSDLQPTYDSKRDVYVFDTITLNETSTYFFINTVPDENNKYTFDIEIISGNIQGLSLFKYGDDNPYGYPGFAYAIKGNVVGTYQFKVYVVGYESIKDSKTFEITVEEPLSKEKILENIIGVSYAYKGSTSTYKFTFTSETILTYTEETVEGSNTMTFNYHLEDGKIVIAEIQEFLTGMYFAKIKDGEILFDKTFNTMQFNLLKYDEGAITETYVLYDFNKVIEPIKMSEIENYINNKTFTSGTSIYGGFATVEITFKDNKGTITMIDSSDNLVATITFEYNYDESSQLLIFTNANSTSDEYTLIVGSCEFDYENQRITIRISANVVVRDDFTYVDDRIMCYFYINQ